MKELKKLGKYTGRGLLALGTLLLLFFLLLLTPPVQKILTRKASGFLSEKLQTRVDIGGIRLHPSGSLVLRGIYLEDQRADTLLWLSELRLKIAPIRLLNKNLQIDRLSLRNTYINLNTDKSGRMNLAFIPEAFASADTVSTPKAPPASPWVISADGTSVQLGDIRFRFGDLAKDMDMKAKLKRLALQMRGIDLPRQSYQVASFDLKETDFQLHQAGQALQASLDQVLADSLAFALVDGDPQVHSQTFFLVRGAFRLNRPGEAKNLEGFDPNHLRFEDIGLDAHGVSYREAGATGEIRRLTARTHDGFILHELQAIARFTPDSVQIRNLELFAGKSRIRSPESTVPINMDENYPLAANLQVESLHSTDLVYWVPALRKLPYFAGEKRVLNSRIEVEGSYQNMRISQLRLADQDISLDLQGHITRVTEPEAMQVDLDIQRLGSSSRGIQAWLPADALPAYLGLPEENIFQGRIQGGMEQLEVLLWGETQRGPVPVISRLSTRASLQHLSSPDSLTFALQIDSVRLTRPDLMAYLPPDLLPAGVDLPDHFVLNGQAQGRLPAFTTDLQLRTYRSDQSTILQIEGRVDSLTLAEQPTLRLHFLTEGWTRPELEAWLPDSLFPSPLKIPNINRLQGRIVGRPDSISTRLGLFSDLGQTDLEATLIEQKTYTLQLDFSDLRLQRLFPPQYLDSILGFAMQPLRLNLQAGGQGFDASPETVSDLILHLSSQDLPPDSGLVLTGKIREQKLQTDLQVRARALQLQALFSADYGRADIRTDLDLQLEQADLYDLGVAKRPLRLSGQLASHFRGLSVDTLSGQLQARNWTVANDSTRQHMDSLILVAQLDRGDNYIDIQSDLLLARLDGTFRIPRVFSALQQQVMGYWQAASLDTLSGQTTDRFSLDAEIRKPEMLTTGLVPGLEELAPSRFHLAYDNRRAEIEASLDLPHIRWSDISLDSIQFDASFAPETFQYELFLRHADLQQIARVPAMRWQGEYAADELTAVFSALDTSEQDRFALTAHLENLGDSAYQLRLAPQQLLDYQTWQMEESNELVLQDQSLQVHDWRLYRKNESIELVQVGKDQIRLLFRQLDLDLLADVLDQQNPYLAGMVNGQVTLTTPLAEAVVEAQLGIEQLAFFGAELGNLNLSSRLDPRKVDLQASLLGSGHDLTLAGQYFLKEKNMPLNLQLDLSRVDLPVLEPLAFGNLKEMQGALSGNLRVSGAPDKLGVEGQVHFDSAGFHVDMLNTRLRLGDQPIRFDETGVSFQDLEIFDVGDQRAVLSGGLRTSDYRSFMLQTDLNADNFTVLNTTSADNDLYYGRMVLDVSGRLRGALDAPEINLFARPRKGSALTYVYRQGIPQVDSYRGVVEFVPPKNLPAGSTVAPQFAESSRALNMKISTRLEISDKLTFKVITNPLTNDYFEGQAAGNLNYTMLPDGRMELTGGLEMVQGDYLFTYQEVVRRKFRVQPGGTIRWTGDPASPQLDLTVLYEAETSPYPLLAQQYPNPENLNIQRKETFRVELSISGDPSDTEIGTALVYPEINSNSNSPEIQQVIRRINQDPSQQNTQTFALILFNGFIGESSGEQEEFQVSDLELESNIGNLITKQLNNLANRYLNFVELDFDLENYERDPATGETRKADFRVSLSKQFLNDRLSVSLDGVASAQANPQATNTTYFLDNLTVAYDLTPDGRFRVKVYNRRDYDDIIGGTSLQVGGALVFSRDFNEIRLFKAPSKSPPER